MPRRPTDRLLLTIGVVCAALVSSAQAQAADSPLPIGTDGHGVRIVEQSRPGHLVVLLSAKRYREVAGNTLLILCADVPRVSLGGGTIPDRRHRVAPLFGNRPDASAMLHPPRRREALLTRLSPRWDWCTLSVSRARHRSRSDWSFATVPLTAAGAAFADERQVAARVIVSELLLSRRPARVEPVVRRMHAVALSSPAEAPPAGRLSIYSDGRQHVYAAQIDRAGDLLFYEQDGDVVRTNLLRYLQDPWLLWGVDPFS